MFTWSVLVLSLKESIPTARPLLYTSSPSRILPSRSPPPSQDNGRSHAHGAHPRKSACRLLVGSWLVEAFPHIVHAALISCSTPWTIQSHNRPPYSTRVASGALFDMITFGTFRSLDAFQYWCHIVALDGDLLFPDQHKDNIPPPWFTDQELGNWVFTPGDLHQCNLILGDDGRLWVIDWDYAGF